MRHRILRALTGLALTATIGCGAIEQTTGPDLLLGLPTVHQILETTTSTIGSVANLLTCALRPASETTMNVGPLGGTIKAGNHRLVIPAGALSQTVSITMTAPSERAAVVKFEPHGLTFNAVAKPTLTLSLTGCNAPPSYAGIKYLTPDNVLLEALKSQLNSGSVTARLDHFSRYAVAW